MDTRALSKSLHRQADDLIHEWGLHDILTKYGEVFYTGSYFLDTLVYPDLDVQILLAGDPLSLPVFFEIGREISLLDDVVAMKFDNCVRRRSASLPEGLYWGIKTLIGNAERRWKIDLWAKDEKSCKEHEAEMSEIARRLDIKHREIIVEIKHSLLTPEGRTPMLSGYHIYQAVLFKGLTERMQVMEYLREHDIDVSLCPP